MTLYVWYLLSSGVVTERIVLNGPRPMEVEAAIRQSYEVKGRRADTVTVVCVLGTILCMVTPLPVSVMLRVYEVI